jgi:hypothetical protein
MPPVRRLLAFTNSVTFFGDNLAFLDTAHQYQGEQQFHDEAHEREGKRPAIELREDDVSAHVHAMFGGDAE